ncbi:hypothetical protein J2847_000098 [Azospirillum agricola]|uniref:hypothetical protein n=1 Tax=Azospirillum agricola TaxID=1720247 RepID=UPI001AE78785|nr:hypothetical protein [Azospirillum agricola]MBP2226831.1 hypothetical protein [Azospirillum agricola]
MQNVAGMGCAPGRDRRPRAGATGGRHAVGAVAFAGPALAAVVAAALTLHLLAELVFRLPDADPLGVLSLLAGMAAVLVTLMPFTLLWACRAQRAWSAVWHAAPPPRAPARIP